MIKLVYLTNILWAKQSDFLDLKFVNVGICKEEIGTVPHFTIWA
jgi:hypothetical protein